MFDKFLKILKNKDIRKKLLQIFLILVIFRVLAHMPLPGINLNALNMLFQSNQLLGIVDLLSGSGLKSFSIVALGVGPYITASIIVQLLTVIIPKLERLSQEGEFGHKKLEAYTRWLTIPFAVLQGYGTLALLSKAGTNIITNLTASHIVFLLTVLTAGTMLLMWMGEIISEKKIGNGMSWIIFAGIISSALSGVGKIVATYDASQFLNIILYIAMSLAVVVGVVFITESQRNIPIIYARQFRDGKNFGNNMSYLPIRVNQVGMVPIIFAASIVTIPSILSQYLVGVHNNNKILDLLYKGSIFFNDKLVYAIFYFIMVILFTFFYTSLVFKADKIAENLNKQGAYIPGTRPGKETEAYLNSVSGRIVLLGAIFLGIVAILPMITQIIFGVQNMMIGGASLLIVVGVIMETLKQLEAYAAQNDYEGKYNDYSLVKMDN
ncbi:MAG: preprotein translocase subunit SecY [Patescibacteria group bacterium]